MVCMPSGDVDMHHVQRGTAAPCIVHSNAIQLHCSRSVSPAQPRVATMSLAACERLLRSRRGQRMRGGQGVRQPCQQYCMLLVAFTTPCVQPEVTTPPLRHDAAPLATLARAHSCVDDGHVGGAYDESHDYCIVGAGPGGECSRTHACLESRCVRDMAALLRMQHAGPASVCACMRWSPPRIYPL